MTHFLTETVLESVQHVMEKVFYQKHPAFTLLCREQYTKL